MSGKTAAIIGATGMIGTYLQQLLLRDGYFSTVRLIVRRPVPKTDPKIEVKLVNFDDAESVKLALEGADVLFCAIGTTRKNVKGDKELYRKVDYEIPVKVARFCKEAGCEKYVIVSAVGADSKSGTFYLKLKGEVEDALGASGLRSVHIMEPSMLLGDRKEYRLMEKILNPPLKLLSALYFGSFRKYKSIHGNTVAKAMVNVSKKDDPGVFKYTYDGIVQAAQV